ncbi:MAG TPA: hypothetical protein VLO13_03345 [Halomonas sp.]|nr:hypothetical protein [Halomonas sp.]
MISIKEIWQANESLDMHAGPDAALAQKVKVFGTARPHCAYLLANRCRDRIELSSEQATAQI